MKRIELRSVGKTHSLPTFKMLCEHSPNRALSIAEIRARVKVLDALDRDTEGDYILLEDSEHATLRKCVEEFPWQQANREVLTIIDDVLEAGNAPRLQAVTDAAE